MTQTSVVIDDITILATVTIDCLLHPIDFKTNLTFTEFHIELIIIVLLFFAEKFCSSAFDGIACWPITKVDQTQKIECPDYVTGFDSKSK